MENKDFCVPIEEFLEKFHIYHAYIYRGEMICFDNDIVDSENLKDEFDQDVFIAISNNTKMIYDPKSDTLEFIFRKEHQLVRKLIGKRLEDELTNIIKPKTKKELYETVARALECGEDYVKSVFEGKRSLRSEYILILEELFGINTGEIFGKAINGNLNRNVLKRMQKLMARNAETGDEIRRYLNELKKKFENKTDDEIQDLCESLTDFLHSRDD